MKRTMPDFEVGDPVRIKALHLAGSVRSIRFGGAHWDYYVTWWADGKRFDEWIRADEIEKIS